MNKFMLKFVILTLYYTLTFNSKNNSKSVWAVKKKESRFGNETGQISSPKILGN